MVKTAEILVEYTSWQFLITVFSVFVRNPGLHLQQIGKFNLDLEVLDWINYVQFLTVI
jgi:hypothetical protein